MNNHGMRKSNLTLGSKCSCSAKIYFVIVIFSKYMCLLSHPNAISKFLGRKLNILICDKKKKTNQTFKCCLQMLHRFAWKLSSTFVTLSWTSTKKELLNCIYYLFRIYCTVGPSPKKALYIWIVVFRQLLQSNKTSIYSWISSHCPFSGIFNNLGEGGGGAMRESGHPLDQQKATTWSSSLSLSSQPHTTHISN
jgi:hypothetical protein